MAPFLSLLLVGAVFLGPVRGQALPMRETRPEKFPRPPEEPARPDPGTPPPSRKPPFFGVGVGFERSATVAGVAISIVLPSSPAWRAGLVAGCIVSEINGELTAGRSGEDCARLIKDGATRVKLKYLDPAMKEKVLILEKEWLTPPE